MKLSGMFAKISSKQEDTFPELTDSMAELIDLEFSAPSIAIETENLVEEPSGDADRTAAGTTEGEAEDEGNRRLTSYTQSRLADLSAFDELHDGSDEDLRQLGALLSRVQAAHHSAREFMNAMHTGIYRANELELAHAQSLAENRNLSQQVDQVKRLRGQHETLIETYKRREAKLLQECDALRVEVGRLGLEANERADRISALDAEHADVLNKIAVKSANADRLARENEILREKQVNLSLDIENVRMRFTEAERGLGEVTALREAETAELSELRSRFSANEKEIYRLQKQHDTVTARLEEAQDSLTKAEAQSDDAAKHHESETHRLKGEIATLKKRLEAAGKAQVEWSDKLGALKQKLADAKSEKKLADDRLAAVRRDFEAERKSLAASASDAADTSLKKQSESIPVKAHDEKVAALRGEIDTLKADIERLRRYERMYRIAKKRRSREIETAGAAAEKAGD